jgi:glycosyltransferase involved in cell wall biosynthesis
MKICLVHNKYGKFSGEEAVVQGQKEVLEDYNNEICLFTRSSAEILEKSYGKVQAFFSGIYNPFSKRAFKSFLQRERPDLVHVHNLFPLISPAIMNVCKKLCLPVVMTVHNYRLICPNGLFMSRGVICERCSGGREYWCLIRNCEGSYLKSLGYTLRSYWARKKGYYNGNVHVYCVLSNFQSQKLIKEGYNPARIEVVPQMAMVETMATLLPVGDYIGYVGRISPEKSVGTLIDAAKKCSEISFKAAGSFEKCHDLLAFAPVNFKFLGHLNPSAIDKFFDQCRVIVHSSTCYEGFPVALIEAMLHGKPVIASNIGGIPEVVEDGVTGLLFEPGNTENLARNIRYLWERPDLCQKMGEKAQKKAMQKYCSEKYYKSLMDVYKKAIQICKDS